MVWVLTEFFNLSLFLFSRDLARHSEHRSFPSDFAWKEDHSFNVDPREAQDSDLFASLFLVKNCVVSSGTALIFACSLSFPSTSIISLFSVSVSLTFKHYF